MIQENADPDVVLDMADYFERLAPERDPRYRHTSEGADDMPGRIPLRSRAGRLPSLTIPVIGGGRMALGTWQWASTCSSIAAAPHRRSVVLHPIG